MAIKSNTIIQGDSVLLLQQVDSESIDLVFADPPFNIGYEYDVYDDTRNTQDYLEWCQQWIAGVHRALKPEGTFWLAIGDEYAAELKIAAQQAGFHCRSWVIWYYTFGVNCRNGFSRSHTHLFHFVKDPARFTFNRQNPQVRVKSARQLVYADNRANPDGRLPDNTWIIRPQDAPLSFGPNHDTWYFARVAGTFKEREGFHGCQMPEQLLARVIRASSNPQDIVLDPFGGSGTTMCVAKKLGRRYVGFELSEEYVDFIQQRLAQTDVGDPIDGPEDAIQSAVSTVNGKRRKRKKSADFDQVIIDAYQSAGIGYPADYLLCDPELNASFIEECRKSRLDGNPYFWNRALLQLRKASKLPRSTRKPEQLTPDQMELVGYAAEVAWRLLAIDYQKTLDDIFCSPGFALEFDQLAVDYGPTEHKFDPVDFRRAAVSIRKRCNKARKTAEDLYGNWMNPRKKLPFNASLSGNSDFSQFECSGVYVLKAGEYEVYVGETRNLRRRLEDTMQNPAWRNMEIDSVDWIPNQESLSCRVGLQSAIANRVHPLLNCRLLTEVSELAKQVA